MCRGIPYREGHFCNTYGIWVDVMSIDELLRAKSIKDEQIGDTNLLLKNHILQTIKRLEALYAYTEQNNNYITNGWFVESSKREKLFGAIAKSLFIHDLGKIDGGFQRKLFDKTNENEKKQWSSLCSMFGWEMFPKSDIKRHEYLSLFWSYFLLNDKNGDWDGKIRTAVLFHHYNQFYTNAEKELLEIIRGNKRASEKYIDFLTKNKQELETFLKLVIKNVRDSANHEFTKQAMDELEAEVNLDKMRDLRSKISNQSPDIGAEMYDPETNEKELDVFTFISGILKRCDHTASAEIAIEKMVNILPFFSKIEQKVSDNIKKSGAEDRFWQKNVLEDVDTAYPLLVAPTGSGKTEFALLWANKQKRKLIYSLPLRVALDDLFKRFRLYADDDEDNESNVSLLHSTAFIQYMQQEKDGVIGSSRIDQKVNMSKNVSTPLILTTPDQMFLASLNFHGADKIKSMYPFSAFVVDEIQAYNPEMAAIIIKSLQEIKKLGGNVLIMTATYPSYFKTFLSNSGGHGLEFKELELKMPQNVKNYNVRRHKVELVDAGFEEKENIGDKKESFKLSDKFKQYLDLQIKTADKNILIICNTVGKAIKVYEFIKDKYAEEKCLYLLHSRLIESEKQKRLNKVKNNIENKLERKQFERVILVATQIVEASVDADFDVLLTEISPIDTQIQRWGRVFRNRGDKEGNHPHYIELEPNIIIFIKPDKITNLIYNERTMEKTIEELDHTYKTNGFLQPLMYDNEKELVDKTFERVIDEDGRKTTLKEYYEMQIKYFLEGLKYFSIEKKSEAQRIFRRIARS